VPGGCLKHYADGARAGSPFDPPPGEIRREWSDQVCKGKGGVRDIPSCEVIPELSSREKKDRRTLKKDWFARGTS